MKRLLTELLSTLGFGGNPRPARKSARAPTGRRCLQCGNSMASDSRRCQRCGAMSVLGQEIFDSSLDISGPNVSDYERHELRLDLQILVAAITADDARIHVLPSKGGLEGEVKAGSSRLCGAAALDAVDVLLNAGLIRYQDDATLVLTAEGRKTALGACGTQTNR